MALTAKEIDSAKPNGKPFKLADGGGLCLLIAPSGAKLWRWRYRFDGKEKMMAFGEYPLVTIKEARERHFAARKMLGGGTDPMADRKAAVEAKQRKAEARPRTVRRASPRAGFSSTSTPIPLATSSTPGSPTSPSPAHPTTPGCTRTMRIRWVSGWRRTSRRAPQWTSKGSVRWRRLNWRGWVLQGRPNASMC